jgi:hypothetical protein
MVMAMNTTVAGLLTGLALGFAGYFGGFGAFVVVAVLGLVGLIVGYLARGNLHPSDYLPSRQDDRRRGVSERPRRGSGERDRHRATVESRGSGFGTEPRSGHQARVQ